MNQSNSKLQFKFIANASGIFIGKNGTNILCDPWIVDGVFEGSWCHFPKLKTTIDDLKNVDAIYISHLHPDHFDERYFDFEKTIPLIVLDHGPNFLIRKLESLGYGNLIKIKDGETKKFNEFELTMYAPFAKHNFHEAKIGNLIDSALLVECEGASALNANDNLLSVAAAEMIKIKHGTISLAMLNYNAAGPYPSCFENLKEHEKIVEHNRILERNFNHLKNILMELKPKSVLPFAGAYVLGGDLRYKNKYLGTTTWDVCADWLKRNNEHQSKVVTLREGDTLDLETGVSDKPYVPIDVAEMDRYIDEDLSSIRYPYQDESIPDEDMLIEDIKAASNAMIQRFDRIGISSSTKILINAFEGTYQIYPILQSVPSSEEIGNRIECKMDERLLRRILDRKSHWNNAAIGAHISFFREPNTYDPDLEMGLQFFHL